FRNRSIALSSQDTEAFIISHFQAYISSEFFSHIIIYIL
uniref:Ovule protein n=1 Tax=Ascaris lumbricoides TaxID=6252 RepID=A0A0M3IXK9_ASCLU